MAVAQVLARLRREPLEHLPIAEHVNQLCRDYEHPWRDRLLTPLVTLRLFVLQILHGNTAITHLRQLSGLDFAPASYCEARQRLPISFLQSLLAWVNERGHQAAGVAASLGHRVLIVDGSNFSMSDTPELNARFQLPRGQKPGVGYPSGKLMGLLDAATGLFIELLALPLFQHDMRSVIALHPLLRPGDIVLGDRAFCSVVHVALLNARGVFACFHLHQRRKTPRTGGITQWLKPSEIPAWMNPAQFAALPAFVRVRLVRCTVADKGFRTRRFWVATTLLDEQAWPDGKIAELYGQRWQIETCFNHLKTTMKMNVLRCKTVDGVSKELAVYLLVYNLVRLAILRAAAQQGVGPDRISFIDGLRLLTVRMLGLTGVTRLIENPDRRGRSQLRVIRRRLKEYDLLKRPRREEEALRAAKAGSHA